MPATHGTHRLLEADEATMQGVCRLCGPVDLLYKYSGGGRKTPRCATAMRLQRPGAKRYQAKTRRINAVPRVDAHGMTREQVRAYLDGKACAICESTRNLRVDHCHDCGAIRGILCQGCNHGLGLFGDAAPGLIKALAYLETMHSVADHPYPDQLSSKRAEIERGDPERRARLRDGHRCPFTGTRDESA